MVVLVRMGSYRAFIGFACVLRLVLVFGPSEILNGRSGLTNLGIAVFCAHSLSLSLSLSRSPLFSLFISLYFSFSLLHIHIHEELHSCVCVSLYLYLSLSIYLSIYIYIYIYVYIAQQLLKLLSRKPQSVRPRRRSGGGHRASWAEEASVCCSGILQRLLEGILCCFFEERRVCILGFRGFCCLGFICFCVCGCKKAFQPAASCNPVLMAKSPR